MIASPLQPDDEVIAAAANRLHGDASHHPLVKEAPVHQHVGPLRVDGRVVQELAVVLPREAAGGTTGVLEVDAAADEPVEAASLLLVPGSRHEGLRDADVGMNVPGAGGNGAVGSAAKIGGVCEGEVILELKDFAGAEGAEAGGANAGSAPDVKSLFAVDGADVLEPAGAGVLVGPHLLSLEDEVNVDPWLLQQGTLSFLC